MKRAFNNIFSIVTPSLNQGRFLEQTIQSVLSQAGDFYIDYIIADGGSIDDSLKIIQKYDALIKSDTPACRCRGIDLRWWSCRDGGQSAALNKAFGEARGDILAWINSDDYYDHENVLQTVRDNFMVHGDVGLICGSGRIVDEYGHEKFMYQAVDVDRDTLLKRGCSIFQPSAFFTREIFDAAGGIQDNLQYAFDFDLWVRITQKSKCLRVDNVLSCFRVWENSKSVTSARDFIREEKYIAKKYGGNIISFRTVQKLRRGILFDWMKKYFPLPYEKGKQVFYNMIDRFHY